MCLNKAAICIFVMISTMTSFALAQSNSSYSTKGRFIQDPKYVSELNPLGYSPDENGWIYNNKIKEYHPVQSIHGKEVFYGWASKRLVDILIGFSTYYQSANVMNNGSLIGGLVFASADTQNRAFVDNFLGVVFPEISPNLKTSLRNVIISTAKGESSGQKFGKAEFKAKSKEYVLNEYGEKAAERLGLIYFLEKTYSLMK